jgi:Tfp pilus assembly protein PilO
VGVNRRKPGKKWTWAKKMIQSTMRLKVLILPVSLVLAVIMLIFFIKPAYTDMMQAKSNLEANKIKLVDVQSKNQKLQKLKLEWQSFSNERNLVLSALPDSENMDAFFSEIITKAGRSGVLLTKIEQSKPNQTGTTTNSSYICGAEGAAGSGAAASSTEIGGATGANANSELEASSIVCLNAVSISLSVRGNWDQVLDFFKYMEDMNRVANINTATITASDSQQGQSSDLLNIEISMTGFMKKKDQNFNSVSADNLASQGKFNQSGLNKLKNAVYAPYAVEPVSPVGVRNVFK